MSGLDECHGYTVPSHHPTSPELGASWALNHYSYSSAAGQNHGLEGPAWPIPTNTPKERRNADACVLIEEVSTAKIAQDWILFLFLFLLSPHPFHPFVPHTFIQCLSYTMGKALETPTQTTISCVVDSRMAQVAKCPWGTQETHKLCFDLSDI